MTEQNRRRTVRGAQKREAAIIKAAVEGFTRDGFHATSTRQIAARARVSEGTLFNYFGSKHDLLLAILDHFYLDLEQTARQALEPVMDTRERLRCLAQNHVHKLLANSAVMSRLIQVYLSVDLSYYTHYRDSHLHQLNYRYTRIFDQIIREGVERGDLRSDLDFAACRDLFFGGLEYGMRTVQGRTGNEDIESHIHTLLEPLWYSMQSPALGAKASSEDLDGRLERACERLEQLAERLQPRTAS